MAMEFTTQANRLPLKLRLLKALRNVPETLKILYVSYKEDCSRRYRRLVPKFESGTLDGDPRRATRETGNTWLFGVFVDMVFEPLNTNSSIGLTFEDSIVGT